MAAHHAATAEMDSGTESVTSTPRSIHKGAAGGNDDHHHQGPRIRLMCSFGGKILPRPHDNQLRYVGGDTRIVAVNRSTSFGALVGKLSKLTGAVAGEFTVKYQLPNEDLDALITVSTDEDVENMMEEWERFCASQANKTARLRLFLFPNSDSEDSRASSISSLLDGSTKRESWFLDALNGGRAVSGDLERGRSEVSSIVSEVPDYLFGLDNSEDPSQARMESKLKHTFRAILNDSIPGSDPSSPSPMVTAPSPFCSSSSAPACVPSTPNLNLPPVKTKPESPGLNKAMEISNEALSEPGSGGDQRPFPVQNQATSGYPGPPVWAHHPHQAAPYPGHAPVQAIPVYYMAAPGQNPGPVQVPHGAGQVQPVHQVPGQFVQQYQMPPGQVPIGYQPVHGAGQMYTGPVRPQMATPDQYHDMQGRVVAGGGGPNPPMYYGIRGGGVYQNYPGMMMAPAGEDMTGSGQDGARSGPV